MKSFKQYISELKIARLYHAGKVKEGQPLQSLAKQIGPHKAIEKYGKKFGREFGDTENHIHHVHTSPDLETAKAYLGKSKTKKLYDVRPGKNMNKVEDDDYGHKKVRDEIPARYIRNVSHDGGKTWEPFNRKPKK